MAAFAYEGTLRRALAGLKYGSAARVAGPLAERASARFGDLAAVAGSAVLVPVPIHPQRLRERGYNQAALLRPAWPRQPACPPRNSCCAGGRRRGSIGSTAPPGCGTCAMPSP